MNGPPAKPTTAWSGRSASRTRRTDSSVHGTDSSGSGTTSRSTSASERTGARHDRPDVLDQLDLDAHAEDREHDVGEHHRRVDAVAPHRLQRHLGAELRLPGDLEERRSARAAPGTRAANARPGA